MSVERVPVLIVGAGPVGLSMAAALQAQGVAFKIIETNLSRITQSRAVSLWTRTLEVLQGVLDVSPFMECGFQIRAEHMFSAGKSLGRVSLEQIPSPFGPGVLLPQSQTEQILEEHLLSTDSASSLCRGVTLAEFTVEQDEVTCLMRDVDGNESSIAARWLIGCDGAHSVVRKHLALPFSGSDDPNDWVLADVDCVAGPIQLDEGQIYWHADGICALFPLGQRRYRVFANRKELIDPNDRTKSEDPTLDEIQELVNLRANDQLRLSEPNWLAAFRVHERKVNDYRVGPVFLAGDAAHTHSPAGGQGMNTGIQDAVNLAWKLGMVERGSAGEKLLNTYSEERSAIGDQVLQGAGLLTNLATIRNRTLQELRDLAGSMLLHLPPVRHKMALAVSMLSYNYRNCSLSGESKPHAVTPGDRLPELQIQRKDGAIAYLGGELSPRHFTVLFSREEGAVDPANLVNNSVPDSLQPEVQTVELVDAISDSTTADKQLEDPIGEARHELGLHANCSLLVRPDRYIAMAFDPHQPQALTEWLHPLERGNS